MCGGHSASQSGVQCTWTNNNRHPVAHAKVHPHRIGQVHGQMLCIQVWEQIQEIRIFNDKGFVRWPPHINLLYPFYEDAGDCFEECAATLAAAVRSIPPFKVAMVFLSHQQNFCASGEAADACCELMSSLVFSLEQVRLSTLRWFDHGRSSTLWLNPESEDLVKLQVSSCC